MATMANPISAGIALGGNLIMGLLAAHNARVRAAKEENQGTNQAIAALDSDLRTIFDASNAGEITEETAIQLLYSVQKWYWLFITPLQMGSIKGDRSSKPFPQEIKCFDDAANPCAGKDCTAGCCLGSNVVNPTLARAVQVFQVHGGTLHVCKVFGSKFGGIERDAYDLTYTPASSVHQVEVTLNRASGLIAVGQDPQTNLDLVIVPKSTAGLTGEFLSGKNATYYILGGIALIGLAVVSATSGRRG